MSETKIRKIRRSGVLVCGVGINDADYTVKPTINGIRTWCPYYRAWVRMLERGYCPKLKVKYPTYRDVTVCEEWHVFSNFRAWMVTQDWENKELDKDILIQGNKEYSPTKCIFVHMELNILLCHSEGRKGAYPLGVSLYKPSGKYRAQISQESKVIGLGYYSDARDAHRAWQTAKRDVIYKAAMGCLDIRVQISLLLRGNQLQYDVDNNLETVKL